MGISNICVPVFLSLLDNIGACGNCYLSFGLTSQSAAKGDNGQSRALQKARNLVPLGITSVVIRKYWNDTENGPLTFGGKSPIVGIRSKGGGCPLAPCATGGSAARELTKKQSTDYPRVGHVDEGSDHPAQRPVSTLLDLYLRMPCLQ